MLGWAKLMAFYIIETCIGCTACTNRCPTDAITGVRKLLHVIDPDKCIDCGACGRACPYDAILDSYGSLAEKVRRTEWPRPVITDEICSGCKYCVDICPFDCLSLEGDPG